MATVVAKKKKGRVGSQERLAFIESKMEMTDCIKEGLDAGLEYPAKLIWELETLKAVSPTSLVIVKDDTYGYGGKGWAVAPWTPPGIVFKLYSATFETFDPPNITEHTDEMYADEYERRQEVKKEIEQKREEKRRATEQRRRDVADRKRLREDAADKKFWEQSDKRYMKFKSTELGKRMLENETEDQEESDTEATPPTISEVSGGEVAETGGGGGKSVKEPVCIGCLTNQPNQMAHMGPDGCLGDELSAIADE